MMEAHVVIQAVCTYHAVSFADIASPSRTPQITWPRHTLVYMLRQHTRLSFVDIGQLLHRDESTIRTSCDRVTARIADDPDYQDHIRRLDRYVQETGARPTTGPTVLDRARVVISNPVAPLEDMQACAVAVVTVASVLSTPGLSDREARLGALWALGHPIA